MSFCLLRRDDRTYDAVPCGMRQGEFLVENAFHQVVLAHDGDQATDGGDFALAKTWLAEALHVQNADHMTASTALLANVGTVRLVKDDTRPTAVTASRGAPARDHQVVVAVVVRVADVLAAAVLVARHDHDSRSPRSPRIVTVAMADEPLPRLCLRHDAVVENARAR